MNYIRTTAIYAVVLSMIALSGCGGIPARQENGKDGVYITTDEFNDEIKSAEGFHKAAENGYLELYADGESAEIAIKDKSTGVMWYSNPQERANDALVSGDAMTELNSQVRVEYIDAHDRVLYMNSYQDCVQYGKHTFAKTEKGLRVTYKIGEKNTAVNVPLVISKDRFEDFLSGMNEDDRFYVSERYDFVTLKDTTEETRKFLLGSYPSLKNHDIYAMANMSMPDFVMEKLDQLFTGAGYTAEDLNRDNTENFLDPAADPVEFTVIVEYTLDGNNLLVRIPHDALKSSSAVSLTKIYLLDFFGAAGTDENGYIFVPDGSGALIDLNNGKNNYEPYQQPVYGRDNSVSLKQSGTIQQQCYLPVFGLKRNDAAFLAVIEKGDSAATVRADISGRGNSYNSVSAGFEVKKSDLQSLPYGNYPDIHMFAKRPVSEDIQIRYLFLYGDDADYSAMALAYQKYLTGNGLLRKNEYKDDIPFSLRMIGTVDYKASMLLMPVKKYKRLTGYADAEKILRSLNGDGISNIHFEYLSWANGGFANRLNNKLSLLDVLGGKKAFNNLVAYAGQNGIGLYPDVDFLHVGHKTMDFNANKSASKTIADETAFQYEYNLGNHEINKSSRRYIVKPSLLFEHIGGFLSHYRKYGNPRISVSSLGTDLNSDFDENSGSNREETKNRIVEALEHFKNNGYEIASSGANAYTLKYLSYIGSMPEKSSGFYIVDRSVPFFQIVTHGFIPYSGSELNLSGHQEDGFLKALELGASPSFIWTYASNHELKNTLYDYYSTHYENWYKDAVRIYNTLNGVLAKVQQAVITRHEESAPGVFKTAYSNGISIIVNYREESVSVGGVTVDAKGYRVVEEA